MPAARRLGRGRAGGELVPDRDDQPGPQRWCDRAADRPRRQRLLLQAVLATAAKFDVRFSITARQDKRIRAAIEAIPETAWQPIPYWLSTLEVSGADIAETPFAVFARDKRHARQVRLVVRRVRPTPGSQLALFTAWDYHASVTDRDLPLAEVEADHRRHAVVEQTIAELKSAGLAHLPSGDFMANAAWLALAVMAHNLGRAVGQLAGPDLERGDRGDAAPHRVHDARTARPRRTAAAPATTDVLARGRPGSASPDPHHRDPAALLTGTSRPDDQDPEKPADRQLTPDRRRLQQPNETLPDPRSTPTEINGGSGLSRPGSSCQAVNIRRR